MDPFRCLTMRVDMVLLDLHTCPSQMVKEVLKILDRAEEMKKIGSKFFSENRLYHAKKSYQEALNLCQFNIIYKKIYKNKETQNIEQTNQKDHLDYSLWKNRICEQRYQKLTMPMQKHYLI